MTTKPTESNVSGPPIIIVKKKVQGHGSHGAAWKVAYADFVTAMMALFMVLWLLSQTDQIIKKELSEYFRTGVFSGAPSILEGGSGLTDKGFLEASATTPIDKLWTSGDADELRAKLESILKNEELTAFHKVVRVEAKPEGVLIEFRDSSENVLFDLSSSKLQPGLIKLLTALGPTLEKSQYKIRIEGHTDARPFPQGSERTNWNLSFERADAARIVLLESGFAERSIVGVYALGSSAPLQPAEPMAAANRRLTLLVIPKHGAPSTSAEDVSQPEPAPSHKRGKREHHN